MFIDTTKTIKKDGTRLQYSWGKVNIITGLNGVGKTRFLKELNNLFIVNENISSIDINNLKNMNFSIKNISMYNHGKSWKDFNNWNEFINFGHTKNAWAKGNFNEFVNINDFKIININEVIEVEKKANFKNLEERVFRFFNKMSNLTSKMIINGHGRFSDPKYFEYEYVKIKNSIDNFLNGKEFIGLDSNGRIIIKDLSGQNINLNQLSHGEIIIFGIASFLLENKNDLAIYIWDEPETNLNPSWQREIIKFVESLIHEDSMLFVVTHSLDILSAMNIVSKTKIWELKRNNVDTWIQETNVFDNEILSNEFLGSYKEFEKEVKENEKFLIVEGITDKLYIESLDINDEIKILVSDGTSGMRHLLYGLQRINPQAKVLCLMDNDAKKEYNSIKENERVKKMVYLNLKDGEEMEKLFCSFLSNNFEYNDSKYTIIKKYDINLVFSRTGEKVPIEIFDNKIKHSGFIIDDKIKHIQKTIPNKWVLANFLIENQKEKIKEKLAPTIEEINEYFT